MNIINKPQAIFYQDNLHLVRGINKFTLMKNHIIFSAITVLLVTVSFAQKPDTLNIRDENGLKQGLWEETMQDRFNYDVKCKFNYLNDKKNGYGVCYFEDGSVFFHGTYLNGMFDGEFIEFDYNGLPSIVKTYNEGVLHGKTMRLWSNGDTVIVENYYKGKQHGTTKEYKSGRLWIESIYEHGREIKKIYYRRRGKVKKILEFG